MNLRFLFKNVIGKRIFDNSLVVKFPKRNSDIIIYIYILIFSAWSSVFLYWLDYNYFIKNFKYLVKIFHYIYY